MNSPEFEELLVKEFHTWDREVSPNPGLLKVEMTKSGFLDGLDDKKAQEIIKLMKERFPEDTAFYWPSELRRLVMFEGTNGMGSDLFYVIFASKEWKPVNKGEALLSIFIDPWLN